MIIDVKHLLQNCYKPCVLTYFGADIFDTYPFLADVYDTPNNRNANVKAVYMFSERHNFKTVDAESFFLKNGLILLPLFLPVNYVKYADERAISDVVLTMYSPMLVGIWNSALDYVNDRNARVTGAASTPPSPIEIYVQWDCIPLKEIRNRINNRLLNMTHGNNQRVFKQMLDATAKGIERTGKSTPSNG